MNGNPGTGAETWKCSNLCIQVCWELLGEISEEPLCSSISLYCIVAFNFICAFSKMIWGLGRHAEVIECWKVFQKGKKEDRSGPQQCELNIVFSCGPSYYRKCCNPQIATVYPDVCQNHDRSNSVKESHYDKNICISFLSLYPKWTHP